MVQFTLKTLIGLVLVVALCLSVWQSHQRHAELERLKSEVEGLRSVEIQDRRKFTLLKNLVPISSSADSEMRRTAAIELSTGVIEAIDVDGEKGNLEIVKLTRSVAYYQLPFGQTMMAALYDNGNFVDILYLKDLNGFGNPALFFVDVDHDGIKDIELLGRDGVKRCYHVSANGFDGPLNSTTPLTAEDFL